MIIVQRQRGKVMADTFEFTLDEESEKKLFELLTDVDVSKTPSFSIKDKHGGEAEYVKVVRCKECDNYKHWECPVEQAGYRPMGDMYCAWAERKEE